MIAYTRSAQSFDALTMFNDVDIALFSIQFV